MAVSTKLKTALEIEYYTYSHGNYTYSPMKAKLTITVDEDLIPQAKLHARSRGQSLSQLVEDGLRQAIAEQEAGFALLTCRELTELGEPACGYGA